jgi:hypothetical protein
VTLKPRNSVAEPAINNRKPAGRPPGRPRRPAKVVEPLSGAEEPAGPHAPPVDRVAPAPSAPAPSWRDALVAAAAGEGVVTYRIPQLYIFQGLNLCHHDTSVYIDDRDCGLAERCCIRWMANTFILAIPVCSTTEAEESRRRPFFRIDGIENITDKASSKASRSTLLALTTRHSLSRYEVVQHLKEASRSLYLSSPSTLVCVYTCKTRSDTGFSCPMNGCYTYTTLLPPVPSQSLGKQTFKSLRPFLMLRRCSTREAGFSRPSKRESVPA